MDISEQNVWSVEEEQRKGVTVHIGEKTIWLEKAEADDIRKIAKDNGLKRFVVKDEEGNLLSPSDFPVETGELYIESYEEGA